MRHLTHPRRALWFGTKEHSQWIPTPLAGADMSSVGIEAGGSYLDGGGYQVNGWDSHKTYTFEWPESSSPEVAQLLKSYRDGTYGRGLIYILDPLTFDKNILPARFADPSMSLGNEAPSLVPGQTPVAIPTSNWLAKGLPTKSTYYNVTSATPATLNDGSALAIPVPEGHTLYLGANYSYSGNGGIYYYPVDATGTPGAGVRLVPKVDSSRSRVSAAIPRPAGGFVLLRLATSGGNGTVTVSAMTALLAPTGYIDTTGLDANLEPTGANYPNGKTQKFLSGKWIGGMGNSGCRFSGTPTYVANSGVDGGRVSVAATFREVGSWIEGSDITSGTLTPQNHVYVSETEPVEQHENLWSDPLPLSINGTALPPGYSRWFGQGGTAAAVTLEDGMIVIRAGGTDSTAVRGSDWGANGLVTTPLTQYTLSVDMETSGAGLQDLVMWYYTYDSAGIQVRGRTNVNPTRVGNRVYYRFTTVANGTRVSLGLSRNPLTAWTPTDLYRVRNTRFNTGTDYTFQTRFQVGDLWYVLNSSGAIIATRRWQGNSWATI